MHVGASRRKATHGRQRVGRGWVMERVNVAPVLVGSIGHHDPPAVPDGLAVGNSAVASDLVARVHDYHSLEAVCSPITRCIAAKKRESRCTQCGPLRISCICCPRTFGFCTMGYRGKHTGPIPQVKRTCEADIFRQMSRITVVLPVPASPSIRIEAARFGVSGTQQRVGAGTSVAVEAVPVWDPQSNMPTSRVIEYVVTSTRRVKPEPSSRRAI